MDSIQDYFVRDFIRSMPTKVRQWSDWSTIQQRNSLAEYNQRSNRKQELNEKKILSKITKCCSSIPSCIHGLLAGMLVACILLSIILVLWLTQQPSSSSTGILLLFIYVFLSNKRN